MIYPKTLKENKTIGVFAPSSGIGNKLEKLDIIKKYLEQNGYKIKITKGVTTNNIVSNTPEIRANEFKKLIQDDEIDVIFCASGGEFALEMAPLIDFELIKKHPKYIIGYSDSTVLTYLITTNCDVASIVSYNFISIYRVIDHKSIENLFAILNGENNNQEAFKMYEKEKNDRKLILDSKVKYIANHSNINVSGRLIGGTIEVLSEIIGMPYDCTNDFINKYKDDGFIWYFDICEMNSNQFYRTLLRMKHLNYFENVKAVLIGKKTKHCEELDISYSEAILKIFNNIPIIEDVDIGHTYPKITLINGAIANITFINNKFKISFKEK